MADSRSHLPGLQRAQLRNQFWQIPGSRERPTIPESHLGIQQRPSEGLEVLWGEERGGGSGQGVFLAATHDVSESFKGLKFPSLPEILENMRKLLEVWG